MIIQTNVPALKAWRNLKTNSSRSAKRAGRLSSGYRINTAADDAAGLAISEKMRAQIRGLTQAERNTQDGISLVQTADGGMGEVHSMLHRMRELSVYACNEGVLTDEDTQKIQDEIDQLKAEIDGVADRTEFNKIKVLSGGGMEMVQVGTTQIQVPTNVVANTENISGNLNLNEIWLASGPNTLTHSVALTDSGNNAVLDKDGNAVNVDVEFTRLANGQVDITVKHKGDVWGNTVIGVGVSPSGNNYQWTTNYNGITNRDEGFYDIVSMNGGFFVGGIANINGATDTAVSMVSLDNTLNSGTPNLPVPNVPNWNPGLADNLQGLLPLNDGRYLIIGREGGSGGTVRLYNANGTQAWSRTVNDPVAYMRNVIYNNGELYVQASNNGPTNSTGEYIYKINMADGSFVNSWGNNGSVFIGNENTDNSGNAGIGMVAPRGGMCFSGQGDPMIIRNTVDVGVTSNSIVMVERNSGNPPATRTWDLDSILPGGNFTQIRQIANTNQYLLAGAGTAAIVTLDDTVPGAAGGSTGVVTVQRTINFTSPNVTVTGIEIDGNGDIWFGGNTGAPGSSQGWVAKVVDDGTQLIRVGETVFGNPPPNNLYVRDIALGRDSNNNITIMAAGSINTGTNGADGYIFGLVEDNNNATIAGVTDVPITLTGLLRDGETEIRCSLANVQFNPAGVIPGTQTGFINNIRINGTLTEYETELVNRPVYELTDNSIGLWLQTGANAGQGFTVGLPDMHIEKLGFPDGMPNVLNLADATASLDYIDDAASIVSTERAKMGAVQNRLEFTMSYLQNAVENLSASESRIRDADMAKEMMEFTKSNVLQQAGMSMLAQANQSPERVLQLLV